MVGYKHTDNATVEYYTRQAPVYMAAGKGGTNRFLHTFVKHLEHGARILDLGCGGCRDSEEMLRLGFDVESWDASPEIALLGEARIKRPVLVKCFEDLDATSEFDATWASASLLHVPVTSLPNILGKVHDALKPNGIHFASYKSGGLEGRDAVGRYFNFLSKKQMLDAYALSGNWQILSVQEYDGGGYENGKQGPWVALIVSKC